MFLGDADIDIVRSEFRAVRRGKPNAAHRACRDIDELRMRLCHLFDKSDARRLKRIGIRMFEHTCFNIKRHSVVPRLAVLLGKAVPLALLRCDVDDDGPVYILDLFECRNQRLRVVAVCNIAVIEPHRAKEIMLRHAAALAQFFQSAVHPAVVLCNGPVVVVAYDDEIRLHLARDIQPLQRLAARHGSVADEGDDVFLAARQIPRLGKTCGKADGGRCVPDVEKVVRTFLGIRIAGDIVIMRLVQIRRGASRQHFVRIALVRDIEYDLVLWRIEHGMQCDDGLDCAKIRAKMPAVDACTPQHRLTHLTRKRPALLCMIALDVRRCGDFFQIQDGAPLPSQKQPPHLLRRIC